MGEIIDEAEVVFVDGEDVPIDHKHADHMVILRDAADPEGDALYYTPNEWEAFILGVKDGEFDDMLEEPEAPVDDTPSGPRTPGGTPGNAGPGSSPWMGRPPMSAG